MCEMFIYEPGSLLKDNIVLTKLFKTKKFFPVNDKTIAIYIAWQQFFVFESIRICFIDHLMNTNQLQNAALLGSFIIFKAFDLLGQIYTIEECDIKNKGIIIKPLSKTFYNRTIIIKQQGSIQGFNKTTIYIVSFSKINVHFLFTITLAVQVYMIFMMKRNLNIILFILSK